MSQMGDFTIAQRCQNLVVDVDPFCQIKAALVHSKFITYYSCCFGEKLGDLFVGCYFFYLIQYVSINT